MRAKFASQRRSACEAGFIAAMVHGSKNQKFLVEIVC
jgi:hypothetical protein